MTDVDPRLVAALRRQLRHRRGDRVGWKLGIGDRERIGEEIAVGHLTTLTRLYPGDAYQPTQGELLHADAEIAVLIGEDGSIAGYGAALELVDLRSPPATPEEVVAANVFHCVVAFGPIREKLPAGGIDARLLADGEVCDAGRSEVALEDRIQATARVLAAVGERLQPGDLVITGSIVQMPVDPETTVEADLGGLGSVRLQVLARS
jgi:2-keto-4-pentenoate hydratase